MGLDFLRDKAAAFTQRRDQSKLQELDTEDLLSRAKPDAVVRVYAFLRTDPNIEVVPGLGLIARVISETEVIILKHGRTIGHVLPEEVADLTSGMRKNYHLGGFLSLTVVDEPGCDGVFTVKPKKAFKK